MIVNGARRQENRWDPKQNEQVVPETKEDQRRLFDDAMFKLEHGVKDQKAATDAKPVLSRLVQRNVDVWKDNFAANSKLRDEFRKNKKEMKAREEADNLVLSRASLVGMSLLPESEEDRQMAILLKLKASKTISEASREKMLELMHKPALPSATITSFGGTKREKQLARKVDVTNLIKKKSSTETEVSKKQKVEKNSLEISTSKATVVVAYSSSSDEGVEVK